MYPRGLLDDDLPQKIIAYTHASIMQMIKIGRINGITADHILRCIEECCQEAIKGYEDECNELIQKTIQALRDDTT